MFIVQQKHFDTCKAVCTNEEYDNLIVIRDIAWNSNRHSDGEKLCNEIKRLYNKYVNK